MGFRLFMAHPSQLYAQQLLPEKFGYPLYHPEPLEGSRPGHHKRGTNIGDVGVITTEGSFKFVFNIFIPKSDIGINHFGVPDGFHPLTMEEHAIERISNKHAEGSEFVGCTEDGVSTGSGRNGHDPSVPAPMNGFNAPLYSGVSLVLPDGASGEDYRHSATICNYIMANALAWHRFINSKIPSGGEMPGSSFYVVTGCDKTSAWLITTKGDPQNRTATSITTFMRRNTPFEPSAGATRPPNHRVFIRGFRVMVREPKRKNIRKVTTFWKRGGAQREELETRLDPQNTYQHPVDIINKHLLHKVPEAQFAVSHECDWWPLTQDGTLASEADIIDRLFNHHSLSMTPTGVFLEPKVAIHRNDNNLSMAAPPAPAASFGNVTLPLPQAQPTPNTMHSQDGLFGTALERGSDALTLTLISPTDTPAMQLQAQSRPAPTVNHSTRPNGLKIFPPPPEHDAVTAEKLAKLDVSRRVELTEGHVGLLGHGRYGPVYHGWYRRSNGQLIALWTVRHTTELESSKEIYKWRQVSQHENVAEFVGIFKTPYKPPYVVSLLYNNTLLDWASSYPDLQLQLAKDITRGLDLIHGNGTVHGNLKAGNIAVSDSGRAQVADFGIASIPGILGSNNRNIRHTAPELLPLNGPAAAEPTKEGDIFSLGILLLQTKMAFYIASFTSGQSVRKDNITDPFWIFDGLSSSGAG
ncbi:hypothetical protein HWV62_22102 [Athelia sp. TMB]|nr:hypothetical protein HWV62_22102 [Athelia sp. TMB]